MWAEDVGHIYHRQYRQAFESRVFSWKDKAGSGRLTGKAIRPDGTRIVFSVRSAPENAAADDSVLGPQ